jgi:hypothetical protein
VLREEADVRAGCADALDKGSLDGRCEGALRTEAEGRTRSFELEGAERFLVKVAIFAA